MLDATLIWSLENWKEGNLDWSTPLQNCQFWICHSLFWQLILSPCHGQNLTTSLLGNLLLRASLNLFLVWLHYICICSHPYLHVFSLNETCHLSNCLPHPRNLGPSVGALDLQQGLGEIMSRYDVPGLGPPKEVPKVLPKEVEVQGDSNGKGGIWKDLNDGEWWQRLMIVATIGGAFECDRINGDLWLMQHMSRVQKQRWRAVKTCMTWINIYVYIFIYTGT